MSGHTPGPWGLQVILSSCGLEQNGYSHQVVIGGKSYTVALSSQRNYDSVHKETLPDGYVRSVGVGRRVPDLTPHADLRLIYAAPELLQACVDALDQYILLAKDPATNPWVKQLRAAIAKATAQ